MKNLKVKIYIEEGVCVERVNNPNDAGVVFSKNGSITFNSSNVNPIEEVIVPKKIVSMESYGNFELKEYQFIPTVVDLEIDVSNLLNNLGIPAHIKGYLHVRRAIIMAFEDPDIIHSVTTKLYVNIATEYETTPSRVERTIRHAINVGFERGDKEKYKILFGFNNVKPTNSQFIATIVEYFRFKRKNYCE